MTDLPDRVPNPALIPAHRDEVHPWQQKSRGGVKEDRMLREATVSLPPKIADLTLSVPPGLIEIVQHATQAITRLDAQHGQSLGALATLLLRAESVASSKIERVEASMDDFARAIHGNTSNTSATSMVASTKALRTLIDSTGGGHAITFDAVLQAHAILMRGDPQEREYAGRIRDVQNWIGGSQWAPRDALFVPPPPETVDSYIEDLMLFANRTDIDAFVQAAVAHAQFESIHPFTDGNGRIGRALINAILRRRGVTSRVVVPLASAMVADRDRYFLALNLYRRGDAELMLMLFAFGSLVAAVEATTTANRITAMPDEWKTLMSPRKNSTVSLLLDDMLTHPVFSAEEAMDRIGRSDTAVYSAINSLKEHGLLRPVTKRVRDQIWIVAPLADELDDLNSRIGSKTNEDSRFRM